MGEDVWEGKMTTRMQYCDYCGEELGVYEGFSREPKSCGKRECERYLRDTIAEEEDRVRNRADQDHYDRYR